MNTQHNIPILSLSFWLWALYGLGLGFDLGAVWLGVDVRKWESSNSSLESWELVSKFSGVWMGLGSGVVLIQGSGRK